MANMIDIKEINFEKINGLIPCIIQDSRSDKVLMLGYMNQEALLKTLEDKRVTFYSMTKQRLLTKGETSKNYLNLVDLILDCDKDTLLIKAEPTGPVCHTGTDTCFNESNPSFSLEYLQGIIQQRIDKPSPSSYTTRLLKEGINKVAQKVGEEAVELVIESKDDNRDKFNNEAADLMYHYLLLLAAKDTRLSDVLKVLEQRHKAS